MYIYNAYEYEAQSTERYGRPCTNSRQQAEQRQNRDMSVYFFTFVCVCMFACDCVGCASTHKRARCLNFVCCTPLTTFLCVCLCECMFTRIHHADAEHNGGVRVEERRHVRRGGMSGWAGEGKSCALRSEVLF